MVVGTNRSVVSMVCSSSVRAPGTVMTALEGMHLLAVRWHPPYRQSALEICPERHKVSPQPTAWAQGRAHAALSPRPRLVPHQCGMPGAGRSC